MSLKKSNDYVEEKGSEGAKVKGVHESLLQESERDIIFFTENFLGKGTVLSKEKEMLEIKEEKGMEIKRMKRKKKKDLVLLLFEIFFFFFFFFFDLLIYHRFCHPGFSSSPSFSSFFLLFFFFFYFCSPSFIKKKNKNFTISVLFFSFFFFETDHLNYLAADSPVGPISVSIILVEGQYRGIVRTEKVTGFSLFFPLSDQFDRYFLHFFFFFFLLFFSSFYFIFCLLNREIGGSPVLPRGSRMPGGGRCSGWARPCQTCSPPSPLIFPSRNSGSAETPTSRISCSPWRTGRSFAATNSACSTRRRGSRRAGDL